MKTILRTLAIALTLTGVAAAARYSAGPQNQDLALSTTKVSAMPIPTCPPDDPNGCGIQR